MECVRDEEANVHDATLYFNFTNKKKQTCAMYSMKVLFNVNENARFVCNSYCCRQRWGVDLLKIFFVFEHSERELTREVAATAAAAAAAAGRMSCHQTLETQLIYSTNSVRKLHEHTQRQSLRF